MKTEIRYTRNLTHLFTILLSMAVILPSCKKNDDGLSVGLNANVMIVNSLEGSSPQDFYLNSAKVNSSAVAYSQSSSYISTNSGSKTAEFKNSGSATANTSTTANLEGGKYYTFYYTGNASSKSEAKTEDDMSAPPSGKCKVRYINLNASATSSVDFALNTTNLATNIAYKSASAFATADPGLQTFKVLATGTSTVSFSFPFTLQAGKIYTIWASGNASSNIYVVTHN